MAQHVSRPALTPLRQLQTAALRRLSPVFVRWWANPLFRHARRAKPLPWRVLRIAVPLLAALAAGISILAWINEWRVIGGLLMGLSLGVVAIPVLEAPVASASRVAHQMQHPDTDPRQLGDLTSQEIIAGLTSVTLWHMRWPIVLAVVLTPALVIGTLHISVSDFRIWKESAVVLGDATPASNAPYLRTDGEIPYFRLALHAVSGGLLPWVLLPLMSSLGVTAALLLEESLLSDLAALTSAMVMAALVLGVWLVLSRTPLLSEQREVLRLLLMILFFAGLIGAGAVLTRLSARLVENA